MGLEYLACPYSHTDKAIVEDRFRKVNKLAAMLIREGRYIYSPISHSHPIAKYGLPTSWEYWEAYDRMILCCCKRLLVYMLEGWDISIGVQSEIQIAKELGLEIEYIKE